MPRLRAVQRKVAAILAELPDDDARRRVLQATRVLLGLDPDPVLTHQIRLFQQLKGPGPRRRRVA